MRGLRGARLRRLHLQALMQRDRERWNARYREGPWSSEPSAFLGSLDDVLPRTGRALDLAGGTGRNALWLARRGLDVTLADVSDVGLEIAARAAAEAGVPLRTLQLDLDQEPVPAGPWDVIAWFHFLDRTLLGRIDEVLARGGYFVCAIATKKNLERHPRPGPAHLLDEGELPTLVRGVEVVRFMEGWTEDGHHQAQLLARLTPPSAR